MVSAAGFSAMLPVVVILLHPLRGGAGWGGDCATPLRLFTDPFCCFRDQIIRYRDLDLNKLLLLPPILRDFRLTSP
jgi:hypothetical protein